MLPVICVLAKFYIIVLPLLNGRQFLSNYSDTSLSSRFMHTSCENWYNRMLFFIRLGLISVTMINTLTAYTIQDEEISCIWDGSLKITDNINTYLADHDQVRNSLLIISS